MRKLKNRRNAMEAESAQDGYRETVKNEEETKDTYGERKGLKIGGEGIRVFVVAGDLRGGGA